jgi:hypothetical protein
MMIIIDHKILLKQLLFSTFEILLDKL